MQIRAIASIPAGGAGCDTVTIALEKADLVLRVASEEDRSESAWRAVFRRITAFRFRNELHSGGFISESYDQLCEINESIWISETKMVRPEGLRHWDMHHYAVMLSNSGYLEVLAEEVTIDSVILPRS